ncbi:MAG: GspH/FimT family pseudopilin [Rhodocyclaceae bacterium]|nr:GspH/FimT family pseudopilin [Rhodocyclaceae bacterium]
MKKAQRRSLRGFTLIELMMTLTIFGILLMVGVPALRGFIVSSDLTGQANDILAAINLARAEAVRRGQRVIFCPVQTAAGVPSTDTCTDPGADSWPGWMVFVDSNSSGAHDPNEEVVRAGTLGGGSVLSKSSLSLSGAANRIVFRPDGIAKAHGGLTIQQVALRICDPSGASAHNLRDIVLTFGSRVSVSRATDATCATPANP